MDVEAMKRYGADDRKCAQLRRAFQLCELLKCGPKSLSQLRQITRATDRTLRRDLAVIARLGWCKVDKNQFGTTVWKWCKQ